MIDTQFLEEIRVPIPCVFINLVGITLGYMVSWGILYEIEVNLIDGSVAIIGNASSLYHYNSSTPSSYRYRE